MTVLGVLDVGLLLVHTGLILFNLTGWIWTRTRRLHVWALSISLGSWLILGLWKGWGYCFLTDLHSNLREQIDKPRFEDGFISFLVESLTGYAPSSDLVLQVSAIIVTVLVLLTVRVNLNAKRRAV